MKKKNIFIAIDTTNLKKAKEIIKESTSSKLSIGFKFGLEFFNSKNGRKFISRIKGNKKIWLDLKLFDIPNTVASSILSLKPCKLKNLGLQFHKISKCYLIFNILFFFFLNFLQKFLSSFC